MCVICVSLAGVPQPTKTLMKMMWDRNPHGAGYMFARSNYVYIRKGFMTFDDFYASVKNEHFKASDVVVYHFRISTQAGVNPEMTHPFILTDDLEKMKVLKARVNMGVCHNGIIPMTSGRSREYSDTALFVANYLSKMVRRPQDFITKPELNATIEDMICSKMAVLDYAGNVSLIGRFVMDKTGLLFSNDYFMPFNLIGMAS